MYKSPIEIVYGGLQTQLEGEILRAVQKVDVVVDKDDLIRALAYDRDQYEKGFRDGVTFAADTKAGDKWIRVDDRLPENDARVLVCDTREDYVSSWEYFGDGLWFGDEVIWATEDITHWMPLPEPPKEE